MSLVGKPLRGMTKVFARRDFLAWVAATAAGPLALGCADDPEPGRYTVADVARLAKQRADEAAATGRGSLGAQRYAGYRGLAELPWFEIDSAGALRCVADDLPRAIDTHCHLGMSLLFAPEVDLLARTPRVQHLLDCDRADPGCPLDLDVYINGNFSEADLRALRWGAISQGLWGSAAARTQTIPNLLAEMDATRVEQGWILPIRFGLPFGDDLEGLWRSAIAQAGSADRLRLGASVHPRDPERIRNLERSAASGARIVKLHPTMQRFYPDSPEMMELYEACERLGLVVFFHTGRAGIEPESTHRYTLPRHYEGALASFPRLPFVLGHAGARDGEAALELALRHENAWLEIHGQGVSALQRIVARTGGERLLFGSDWPFYHLAATLREGPAGHRGPGRAALRPVARQRPASAPTGRGGGSLSRATPPATRAPRGARRRVRRASPAGGSRPTSGCPGGARSAP